MRQKEGSSAKDCLFFCLFGKNRFNREIPEIIFSGEKSYGRGFRFRRGRFTLFLLQCGYFAIMIKVLQMCGKTDVYTYNVRVAAIQDWPGLFLQRWAKLWKVLWSEYPYNPPAAYLLMSGIALTALAVSWRQRKFWYGIFCFAGMVYGAYIVTFFTIWEFFETFRMHCYSVPFIAAVLYAVVLRSRQTVFCNEALVVAACLILVYA